MKMSEEAKRERSLYMKEFRKRHPDKAQEYTIRYWEKKAKERKEREASSNSVED